MKTDKRMTNDPQNTTHETKDQLTKDALINSRNCTYQLEGTKRVIRNRQSKNGGKYNGENKRDKKRNSDPQNTTEKSNEMLTKQKNL